MCADTYAHTPNKAYQKIIRLDAYLPIVDIDRSTIRLKKTMCTHETQKTKALIKAKFVQPQFTSYNICSVDFHEMRQKIIQFFYN